MAIIHITKENFDAEVMQSEKPVLVDFFATWCGPCKMQGPILEQVAQEYEQYKICKIDIDEQPELANKFGVMSVPTLMVIKNGQVTQMSAGMRPKNGVIELIEA